MPSRWQTLLDEKALADVLPPEYERFARPVRDALVVFLEGMPPEDQASVLAAQAALPPTASFSQRLGELARCSPVLQKLGQVLARDQRLAIELRLQFQPLESLQPTFSASTIERLLVQELGPLERRGVELQPPALAEASVAVVIPYRNVDGSPHARNAAGRTATSPARDDGTSRMADGTTHAVRRRKSTPGRPSTRQGVFKILKPGIEQRLDRELALLEKVGEHLDERCSELNIPALDYREAFQQVRSKLRDEVNLRHEQRHLQEARKFFADEPRVVVPRLFEHSTSRVTAMERIDGHKVTDNSPSHGRGRNRLATLVAEAMLARPIFSTSNPAMFHGDPHAGNLFLTRDGRLGILDWSLVGRLRESERVTIVQVMLAAVTLDERKMVKLLAGIDGSSRPDRHEVRVVVRRWLRKIRRGRAPGFGWLMGMLDDATQHARLRAHPDLMLFRKSLHTLQGVVADVGGDAKQMDRVVACEFIRHFIREWPRRWMHSPFSRRSATRLSNADLMRLMLSGPATATRFWSGQVCDILEACMK